MGNAKSRILKNGHVLSFKEQAISQIEGTDRLAELYRAFSKNAPKIEKGEEVIGRNGFSEEWDKGCREWGSEERNL